MIAEAALAMVMAAGPEPIQKGPKTHDSPISLYQGRHYAKRDNGKRLCIRQRESKHDYRAVSSTAAIGAPISSAPSWRWVLAG